MQQKQGRTITAFDEIDAGSAGRDLSLLKAFEHSVLVCTARPVFSSPLGAEGRHEGKHYVTTSFGDVYHRRHRLARRFHRERRPIMHETRKLAQFVATTHLTLLPTGLI